MLLRPTPLKRGAFWVPFQSGTKVRLKFKTKGSGYETSGLGCTPKWSGAEQRKVIIIGIIGFRVWAVGLSGAVLSRERFSLQWGSELSRCIPRCWILHPLSDS